MISLSASPPNDFLRASDTERRPTVKNEPLALLGLSKVSRCFKEGEGLTSFGMLRALNGAPLSSTDCTGTALVQG
jgi:hypothetical protein